jgi:2-polyprenyl-3-methyl-5-hydroxy-6-metoxy-1,4-benzoquinol methylase
MAICIGCGLDGSQPVLQKGNLRVERCPRCAQVFLATWAESFPSELYDYYQQRVGVSQEQRYRAINSDRIRELLGELAHRVQGRRLLDVGCGEGQLVHTALGVGWDAHGIDLSAPAIQICQSFGLPCRVQDFFSPDLDGERFDVVIMSELIEHVPLPGRFLARAEQLLVPDGICYLTSPNFGGLTRRLVGPAWREIHPQHFSYFTPQTLAQLVKRDTGLAIMSLQTRNIAPFAILSGLRNRRVAAVAGDQPSASGTSASAAARASDQVLRERIHRSAALATLKRWINRALDVTGAGDTIVLLCQRRREKVPAKPLLFDRPQEMTTRSLRVGP